MCTIGGFECRKEYTLLRNELWDCFRYPGGEMRNALISMYAKCGVVYDGAFAAFCDMDEKDVVSWNAMIAGFHENNLAHDAYMLFRHMLQEPIEPNYATVATVLPLCAAQDNEAAEVLGRELHGYVAGRTELRESNYVINSLMSFYVRIGRTEEAEILFYGMCSRDLVSWSAIIACYVFNNDWARALQLFRELIFQWQEKPDCASLVSILSACANMHNLQLGKQIHGYAYRHFGLYDGTVICNALVSSYSKCGDLRSSLHTFMNSAQRDLFSWNSILDSFAKNGNESHVDNLLHGMIEGGLRPDSITMLTLFQFYGSLSSLLRVKEAHCYLLRSCCFQGDTENRLTNTMLEAYGKCGKIDYAFKIFESLPGNVVRATYNSTSRYATSGSPLGYREGNRELKKDIASWNYMIPACAENDIPENALALFHEMQDFGMKPDGESIISILPICARTASVNFLRQCHGYAVISFPQDSYLVGTLIDAYSKCGTIGSAYKLFISTCDKDLVMFTAMICGYTMHGMGKEALEVLSQILDTGIRPDNVVIAAVLSACSHSGLVDESLAIFNSLDKVLGIKPTMEQYACIVDLLARRGRVRDAYSFVKEMPVEADSNIWGTLLGACWACNDLELGKIVADHLSRIEVNDIGSYVAMSNLHAADARWDGVKEMRELMKTRDLKKPAGCSWVEVDMVKHVFTSGNSSHPEAGAIYKTLGMLDRLAKQTLIPQAIGSGAISTFDCPVERPLEDIPITRSILFYHCERMMHRAWAALIILTYTETNWSFADGASSLTDEEMRVGDSEERMDMLWEDFNMDETKERIKLAQLHGFSVTRRNVSKGRVSTKRASSVVTLLKKKLHYIRQKSDRQFRKKDH